MRSYQVILFVLSVACYVTSLFLPFFENVNLLGWECLIYGAYVGVDLDLNALFGILAWSANLVYLASLVTGLIAIIVVSNLSDEIKESKGFNAFMLASGIIGSVLLLALAAFSYGYTSVRIDTFDNFVARKYAISFYLWIGSFVLLAISSIPVGKKS